MDTYLKKLIQNKDFIVILNTIFDGIYIVDIDRNIVFWNKGAENITGYNPNEVCGHRCSANILNHIDENGILLCNSNCPLTKSIKSGKNHIEKIYPKHKNNTRFPVLTHVAPIKNDEGVTVGAIEVFRDVSKDEDFRILQEKFNIFIQKYISKTTYSEIVQQVKHGKSKLNVIKDLTIMYLDIVNFTEYSEKIDPNQIALLLNDMFGICDVITRECHGDIDKFIGDSIMATFIDANDAVEASLKILASLALLNKDRKLLGLIDINLRIGINSGNVVQVEVGTKDRKDFTVLGDVVNTASRIQAIAESGSIYISESTFSRLRKHKCFAFAGTKKLKGKKEKINVYKYNLNCKSD